MLTGIQHAERRATPAVVVIFTNESWPIPRPVSVATSPAFPGRPIGRAKGLDLPFPGHFAKKSSDFKEINPQSNLLSQNILQKNPQFFFKINPQSNVLSQLFLQKKTRNFQKYNPPSKSSWAGLPLAPWASVGRIWPKAGLPYLLFFSNYELICSNFEIAQQITKNHKIENQIVSESS